MDPSNLEKQQKLQEPRYLDFPHLPDGTMRDGKLALNKYSSIVTNGHDFPGAQVYYVAVAISQLSQLIPTFITGHALRRRCAG